ncbi:MAG: SDR family oxidoreductase [Rhizobiaceae bacterium]|nr:SDR family oxidoreductase [Rhizobiaceae bacterium]
MQVLDGHGAFAGRRVLIAGASSGLGKAAARAFAAAGARLALGARRGDAIAALAEKLDGDHIWQAADLSDAGEAKRWAGDAIAALGGVDVLVVTLSAGRPSSEETDFRASFETDLMAPLRLLDLCRDGLAASRGAAVFCSSRTAHGYTPQTAAYGAAKAGLEYAVRCAAADLVRHGVRVNALAPGSTLFEDGFWARCETERPDLWKRTIAALPAGRLGTAEDLVPPLLFLCSDAARWITGQTLLADGGQTLAPFVSFDRPEQRS